MWGEVQGLPGQRHTFCRARVVFVLLKTRPDPVSSARGGFCSRIICFWQTQHATIVYQSYGIIHLDFFFMEIRFIFLFVFCSRRNTEFLKVKAPFHKRVRVMKSTDKCEKPTEPYAGIKKSCCQGGSNNTGCFWRTARPRTKYEHGRTTVKSVVGEIQRINTCNKLG